jgi:hypothetical protein
VLVVPGGAAVLADPGEGPLHYPAARQHLKDVPVALGHDLDGDFHGGGPGGELAGSVSGVGPDQTDLPAGTVQVPQQRPGSVAVLDRGGGDHHGQHQAHGVHRDVPFAAVDFLGVIPAAGGLRDGVGGGYGLGVDDRGCGLGIPPGSRPDPLSQRVVQPGQGAVFAPGGEVPINGLPGREVRGQVPPRAPGPVQVQDRLHDPADRPDSRPAPPPGLLSWHVRGDDLPLGIGQVTGIAPGAPSGPPRTLGARGPPLVFDRHKSGS